MPKGPTEERQGCGTPGTETGGTSCCKVDALVTIDGRGQIVLPKDVRAKAGIQGGDKLAVVSWESNGKVCCISLVKADEFAETVKGMLGPVMKEIFET